MSNHSNSKEPACNADLGLIPGFGRSPGERNDNPLQYACLENFMDRAAWGVHRVAESDVTEQLTLSLFTVAYVQAHVKRLRKTH